MCIYIYTVNYWPCCFRFKTQVKNNSSVNKYIYKKNCWQMWDGLYNKGHIYRERQPFILTLIPMVSWDSPINLALICTVRRLWNKCSKPTSTQWRPDGKQEQWIDDGVSRHPSWQWQWSFILELLGTSWVVRDW